MRVENCDAIKNKFAVLSLILNRTRLQLYRRLHTLKMQPKRGSELNYNFFFCFYVAHTFCFLLEHIRWTIDNRQELFTNILLETNTDDWRDLKNTLIKKETWIKIAECFSKSVSYEKCRTQWKFLSTMLFCETPITYSVFKLNILNL